MKSSQGLENMWLEVELVMGPLQFTPRGVTMEFEVPRRHILRPTLSNDMVQRVLGWERQKRCSRRKRQVPMLGEYCSWWISNIFFCWREREREWSNFFFWFFLRKLPFLDIYWKKSSHSFLDAWSFPLVHIQFPPSEGPESFVIDFEKNT